MDDGRKRLLAQAAEHIRTRRAEINGVEWCALVERLATALREEADRGDAWRKALGTALQELDRIR